MKRLTTALLVFSVFGPPVFAQSVESAEQADFRVFSGWLGMVKGAEKDFKNKNGRYGDLVALRKAHLLRSLVFESDSSAVANGKLDANFVPKRTLFQVTVSADGQHFRAVIGVKCTSTMIDADDTGYVRYGVSDAISCPPVRLPLLDSPEGPIISVSG